MAITPHSTTADVPQGRMYFLERRAEGIALVYSDVAGAEALAAMLPEPFGADESDLITSLELSPNHRYVALNAQREHGEVDTVWIVTTESNSLRTIPADANGLFLHWLPDGEHFLFRPYLKGTMAAME